MIGTKIILEDQSYIPSLRTADPRTTPIIFMGFTSDKGTEEYKKWQGKDFFNQYGEISFARHGQPLLQAANVINNGGIVYAKRVVDPTAKVAMLGVVAHTKQVEQQEERIKIDPITHAAVLKADGSGEYETEKVFWKKEDHDAYTAGKYTIDDLPVYSQEEAGADAVPAKYAVCEINFTIETLTAEENINGSNFAKNGKDFYNKLKNNRDSKYPLFLLTDNGRGESNKRITISLDDTLTRSAQAARYVIDVSENNSTTESLIFSLNPSEIENNLSLFIQPVVKRSSSQLLCYGYEDQVELFLQDVSTKSGIPVEELLKADILGARNWRGQALKRLKIVTATTDGARTVKLDRFDGHPLTGGTNGETFGRAPIETYKGVGDHESVYAKEMTKVYDGTFNDDIFDVDNNPIDIVVDANYPHETKRAIEALCTFRQDVFFFRDMGTRGLTDIVSIKNAKLLNNGINNRFVADYCQYYDIIDPYTRKQITVTIGYSIARLICMHFFNGRSLVCAGINNGWTIPEIVEGSLSYVPKITPAGDQVNEMDDLRVNFGKYYNNIFTIATEYTAQDIYTQLSFLNNVLSIQELIKQIRIECPKSRYKFITGTDFEDYKSDVQAVINANSSKFASIEIDFNTDSVYASNKIVYAVIKVSFKDFAQAEIFRIIAIPIAQTVSSTRI